MKVAIVSTSINSSPDVYTEWAKCGDLIVAGDLNAPEALRHHLEQVGGLYLSVARQSVVYEALSNTIGWKNIQRRNIAIMYAMQNGYDFVLTVDDDNLPQPTANAFLEGHLANLGVAAQAGWYLGSTTGFLNTGELCVPAFHQRGVPYGINTRPIVVQRDYGMPIEIVVSQAQVVGDPDCDAVERMCYAPNVMAVISDGVVLPGTYAPFNSQATLWRGDWAGVMACLPHIGRFDDIFASLIFSRIARAYGVTNYVGSPVMRQERNEHDLVKDLRAEVWGMRHTFTFTSALDNAYITNDMPLWHAYDEVLFAARDVLPQPTLKFVKEWVAMWKELGK